MDAGASCMERVRAGVVLDGAVRRWVVWVGTDCASGVLDGASW